MALGATIYTFKIDLADSDRSVYAALDLRVARHPSETEDHLLTRVLAYCLEYTEGIGFSSGISDADQPAIAVRDLTGALITWIDIGAPEGARLHRASKLASRVAVYTHKEPGQLLAKLQLQRIHRAESLEIYAVDRVWLAALAAKLARRMEFALTVADRNLYLSLADETLTSVVQSLRLAGE
ncbi:MAG: hypothetical protein QOF42_2762 [Gammaproteobacteria bacterium]|jgi:uncharacterized protein YaeQ|nr:hypothetical protein [Gammaproteobacteria bacterium]